MYIQLAIEKAIESEYESFLAKAIVKGDLAGAYIDVILLDPLFWQSLGKALGWEAHQHPHWRLSVLKEYDDLNNAQGILSKRLHPWEAQMVLFISHLSTGADANSFFKSLLEK